MAYYRVTKTMKYTVTCYVEADGKSEAEDASGNEDGEINCDDIWYSSDAVEISEEDYMAESQ